MLGCVLLLSIPHTQENRGPLLLAFLMVSWFRHPNPSFTANGLLVNADCYQLGNLAFESCVAGPEHCRGDQEAMHDCTDVHWIMLWQRSCHEMT